MKERKFQSTLPARGATEHHLPAQQLPIDFNPRSPHGERHLACMDGADAMIFQSTLPARGATYKSPLARCQEVFQSTLPARGATGQNTISGILTELFQSTLPARGATRTIGEEEPHVPISIHAPRTGSDCHRPAHEICGAISIHAPRTGSDDGRGRKKRSKNLISIHAPRTGSDVVS